MRNGKRARRVGAFVAGLALVCAPGVAWSQDTPPAEPAAAPAKTGDEAGEQAPTKASEPKPLAFENDFDAALARAGAADRPLLVVAVPDWYESPAWKKLRDEVLTSPGAHEHLGSFVRVLVEETADREVHVRHRLRFQGYPLAVVLDATGAYLGHVSGVPSAEGTPAWPDRISSIPTRAAWMAKLRRELKERPEDPELLFELGRVHVEAGEFDRAAALFERMEEADPLSPPKRLGEARYQRLRHAAITAFEKRSFGDVESACRKWLRRFGEHERRGEVLLLQASARYLSGDKDGAAKVWKRIGEEFDAKTSVAKRAAEALKEL